MVEQGYNYLDGPIHTMAEFFKTRIENLEKSIPPSVPSRNKNPRKVLRKRLRKAARNLNLLLLQMMEVILLSKNRCLSLSTEFLKPLKLKKFTLTLST